ncbi:B-cell receptor CD22-like [Sardina pilchardus]|uniref:B-cell receptor CD22-like n=1 Tax=Sardina pilchardus TaxID=27697 RepID=UPI002E105C9A
MGIPECGRKLTEKALSPKVCNLVRAVDGQQVLVRGPQGASSVWTQFELLLYTTLQVSITPEAVIEEQRVTLTCNTTCILTNPTFIWYKNGHLNNHTTRDNKLHLNPVSSEDTGNYSCAVRGHESLSSTVFLNVRYSPRKTSLSISHGKTEEGSSVTLTCSSDANPPVHNYTWYMKSGAESVVRGTGESISFNVTSDTSGLYHCEAQNELGSQNSADAAVPSKGPEAVIMILMASITIFIILALILGIVRLR